MNLASMDGDNDLINAFMYLSSKNLILLIEDIDTMFSRGRRVEKNKINFSTLLNCLDGAFYKHGLISIMTTNHADKLDPALIRRGRIDMQIEFPNPDETTAKKYIKSFYNNNVELNGELKGNSLPMSHIQEICLSNDIYTIKETIKKANR